MEQANQQTIQKPTLPIKTKIAAWWMMVIGSISLPLFLFFSILLVLSFPALLSGTFTETAMGGLLLLGWIFSLLIVISFFLPAIFLLKGKRWSWKFAIIMLVVDTFSPIWLLSGSGFSFFDFLIPIGICVFPLILLFLDRKNFWKIAT